MKKGKIVWQAETGGNKCHRASTNVSYIYNNTAITTFMVALNAHTKCNQYTRTYMISYAYPGAIPTGTNADRKAILYYRDELTGGIISLSYPEPIDADVENTDQGERIKQSVLDSIKADLEAATTRTYHSLYGIVVQST